MRLMLGALAQRGARGLSRERLQVEMGLSQSEKTNRRAFFRDLRSLRAAGYDIRSCVVAGQQVYVLHVIDPRIRTVFTEAERKELLRAARKAGLGQLYEDLDPGVSETDARDVDPTLGLVERAIERRCITTFSYHAKARVVHPYEVSLREKGWLLRAREDDGDVVKSFYLQGMDDVVLRPPGTAEPVPTGLPWGVLDPMRWDRHPPVDVDLVTTAEDVGDVISLLGANGYRVSADDVDGTTRVTVVVTHMDALLSRLLELGTRARLVGPEQARTSMRELLQAFAGGGR